MRIATAICIEFAYVIFTRLWLRGHSSGIELELLITGCRLVVLSAYWLLFRDVFSQLHFKGKPRPTFLLYGGVASLLMVPLLFFGGYPSDHTYRTIFALTSIVVAIREEVFYRGLIQALLEKRFGLSVALIASNALFVFYHFGAQPLTASGAVEIFAMGYVLGLLYCSTGSLLAPIALHAVYDAMWSVGPILTHPLPDLFRIPFHVLGAILVFGWASARLGRRGVPAQ